MLTARFTRIASGTNYLFLELLELFFWKTNWRKTFFVEFAGSLLSFFSPLQNKVAAIAETHFLYPFFFLEFHDNLVYKQTEQL